MQSNIIQSIHFTAHQDLKDFVTEKICGLTRFFFHIELAKVSLKLEKSKSGENKICEIRLGVPGNDLYSESSAESFEEALVNALDAMQQQLKKMKAIFEDQK